MRATVDGAELHQRARTIQIRKLCGFELARVVALPPRRAIDAQRGALGQLALLVRRELRERVDLVALVELGSDDLRQHLDALSAGRVALNAALRFADLLRGVSGEAKVAILATFALPLSTASLTGRAAVLRVRMQLLVERLPRCDVHRPLGGGQLAAIRDDQSWKSRYNLATFEEYCEQRWELAKVHAWRLIEAASFAEKVSNWKLSVPSRESHIRPLLSRLEADEDRIAAG